jgi:hypothetical protein
MKFILTLLLITFSTKSMAEMTHVFYCTGENTNSPDRIFTEVHYQMIYSGKFLPQRVILKKLPENYLSNELELAFQNQSDFELISSQSHCPRTEVFPVLCQTKSNDNIEQYFYTWLNIGFSTFKFSDYILKRASAVVNAGRSDSRYSYGKYNREYVGDLIKCNFKWAQIRE